MNSDTVIYSLLGICILVVMFFVLSKPLKLLGRILLNSAIGLLGFVGMNFLLSPLSVSVGINALTLLIVGILGIPGFICLYLSSLML